MCLPQAATILNVCALVAAWMEASAPGPWFKNRSQCGYTEPASKTRVQMAIMRWAYAANDQLDAEACQHYPNTP